MLKHTLFKIILVGNFLYVHNMSMNGNTQDSSRCDCIAMKSFQVIERYEDRLVSILWRVCVCIIRGWYDSDVATHGIYSKLYALCSPLDTNVLWAVIHHINS